MVTAFTIYLRIILIGTSVPANCLGAILRPGQCLLRRGGPRSTFADESSDYYRRRQDFFYQFNQYCPPARQWFFEASVDFLVIDLVRPADFRLFRCPTSGDSSCPTACFGRRSRAASQVPPSFWPQAWANRF